MYNPTLTLVNEITFPSNPEVTNVVEELDAANFNMILSISRPIAKRFLMLYIQLGIKEAFSIFREEVAKSPNCGTERWLETVDVPKFTQADLFNVTMNWVREMETEKHLCGKLEARNLPAPWPAYVSGNDIVKAFFMRDQAAWHCEEIYQNLAYRTAGPRNKLLVAGATGILCLDLIAQFMPELAKRIAYLHMYTTLEYAAYITESLIIKTLEKARPGAAVSHASNQINIGAIFELKTCLSLLGEEGCQAMVDEMECEIRKVGHDCSGAF